MTPRQIATGDGRLKFLVSDPLEEYRVETLLTKEPETIAWIDGLLVAGSDAPLFWDVGSNIGIYTLYAAAKSPKVRVISIEPFFNNFVRLKANIQLNQMCNVAPLFMALGRESGLAMFSVHDERFGASGNVISPDRGANGGREGNALEMMLKVSGNDLLKLRFPPPNFVKIDVDGLEREIIDGMTDVMASDALQSILVEINSKEDFDSIENVFANHGLKPDDRFNMLENHSRKRRAQDSRNTAANYIFTKI